jgi:thiol-disulfide isomerase/thioredoxin
LHGGAGAFIIDAVPLLLAAIPPGLAALLVLAVLGKVLDRTAWLMLATRIAGTGERRRLLVLGLPAGEAVTAIALVIAPRAGLVGAAALFAALGAGVLAVRRDLAGAPCACFGAVAAGTVGTPLAVRNLVLAAVAVAGLPAAPTTGPPSLAAVAFGLALATTFVLGLRVAAARRALAFATGRRLRLAGVTPGRPALVVAVAAGCGPCEAVLPEIPAVAETWSAGTVLAAVAPGPGAGALHERLGALAPVGLWERLLAHGAIPGTPFQIVLDRSGRIVASGPAGPGSLLEAATPSPAAARDAVSRGMALRLAVGATAALVLARSASTPTVASARRRRFHAGKAWTFKNDPRNEVQATCDGYVGAPHNVYDATGTRLNGTQGYTWSNGFETGANCAPPPAAQRLKTAYTIAEKRVSHTWHGHCPCPQNQKAYDDQAKCNVECPSGLACFGYQCVTDAEEYCIEVLYTIKTTEAPNIVITALEWIPPASSTPRCKVYARSFNDFVVRHEEQHAQDILDVIKEWEKKNDRKYVRRCAPTQLEAMAAIVAAIDRDMEDSYADLMQMDCARNAAFHSGKAGQALRPRCEMCR